MNKNGWASVIFDFILIHIMLSGSSISSLKSGILSEIIVIIIEFGIAYYLTGYLLARLKLEHFKHIENPHHWSHKPYQTYFIDEKLKLL